MHSIVVFSTDAARRRLTNGGTGKILSRLVSLAVNSSHSEVQYNSAGTIGQMASTGRYIIQIMSVYECNGTNIS